MSEILIQQIQKSAPQRWPEQIYLGLKLSKNLIL